MGVPLGTAQPADVLNRNLVMIVLIAVRILGDPW
jgi:hypothetical protein